MEAAVLRGGERIGDWIVDEVLMRGELARYRAHRAGSPDDEAVVDVAPRDARDGLRLRRETYALRQLHGRGIPTVLDRGETGGGRLYWVATRWFDGESLSDLGRAVDLSWQEVASIFYELSTTVLAVHASGMVHRDIHPAKIRVSHNLDVRLEGFELAMSSEELKRVKRPPLGELAYVAPEVIRDRKAHAPRADLYALGVVLYEVLTGRSAFPAALWGERADPEARMLEWKSRTEALDPGADFPRWLRNLVRKSTDPDPDKRLPDMDAMLGWLEAAREQWEAPDRAETKEVPRPSSVPTLGAVAPSIAPPRPSTVGPSFPTLPPQPLAGPASVVPVATPGSFPMGVAYAAAGVLGMVAGLSVGVMILVFLALSRFG